MIVKTTTSNFVRTTTRKITFRRVVFVILAAVALYGFISDLDGWGWWLLAAGFAFA